MFYRNSMNNNNKIAVEITTGKNFLREGVIISEHKGMNDTNVVTIKFGVNDIENYGYHMFALKEDLVDSYKGINKGDIKYFIWDNIIYQLEIVSLIKDRDSFIAKSKPDFFGSKFISNLSSIDKLIHNKINVEKLIKN